MSGLFVAAKPSRSSLLDIYSYCRGVGLDQYNLIPPNEIHVTLCYTKQDLEIPFPLIEGKFDAYAKAYNISYIGSAIAILLISPYVRWRMNVAAACGVRSKFPAPCPHVSVIYDPPTNINLALLPRPNFNISLVSEFSKSPK